MFQYKTKEKKNLKCNYKNQELQKTYLTCKKTIDLLLSVESNLYFNIGSQLSGQMGTKRV